MTKYFLLLGMILGSLGAQAQQTTHTVTAKTEYFDKYGHLLPSATGASYRVEVTSTAGLGGVEERYSLEDNHLCSVIRYDNLRNKRRHGLTQEYYPSGQLELSMMYNQGSIEGEILGYYPNGQLKRREQFRNYVSQGGECFDEEGKPIAFFPHLVLPLYKGGIPALLQHIGQKTHYPLTARKAGQEAKVLVDFIVDEEGKVQKAHVRQEGYPLLDAEAVRVVSSLRKWVPGQQEGKVKATSFTLPVTFSLR